MSEVDINACWREAVKKEKRSSSICDRFDFNPKNMIAITEKPTTVMTNYNRNDSVMKTLKERLASTSKIPKSKFNYPMTSSQEIGWDMDTHAKIHEPKGELFNKRRSSCPEAIYVADYVKY